MAATPSLPPGWFMWAPLPSWYIRDVGSATRAAQAGTASILLGVREIQFWAVIILGFISHPPKY